MKLNGNVVLATLTASVLLYFGYSQFNATAVKASGWCNCSSNGMCPKVGDKDGNCLGSSCTIDPDDGMAGECATE
jgi:hypothetical protein